MPFDISVERTVTIALDAPTLQKLVDELTALIARPAIGPDANVAKLEGGSQRFRMVITKPDL